MARAASPQRRMVRLGSATAALLLAGGALSACAPHESGAAAIVGNRVISDNDVQTATSEVNTALPGLSSRVTTGVTVVSLIIAPYVLRTAAASGHGVSDSQAKAAIAKLGTPSRATLEFVRSQLAVSQLTPADQKSVLAQLKAARIKVSPRYGSFDPSTVQLAAPLPNWVKREPGEAPTQSGTGGSTGP
jgi:hypothetical protein